MGLTLTPRLRAVAGLVPQGARLCDVGTDHGYLPVGLLLEGKISRAIACDLREGPLRRARETARRYGVEKRITFRRCDGLAGIKEAEADAVAIAGMGGENIANILADAPWTRKVRLLLQPMSRQPELRGWLTAHDYCIEREQIAREGERYYCVLSVTGGGMAPLTPPELWAGRPSEDPLRGEWLAYVAAKIRKMLEGRQTAKAPDEGEVARLRMVLAGLEQMRRDVQK